MRAEADIIDVPSAKLARVCEGCRHNFDRAFIAILADRLAMANLRLSGV